MSGWNYQEDYRADQASGRAKYGEGESPENKHQAKKEKELIVYVFRIQEQ